MCSAAAAFLAVGPVRHLAPDPWAPASGQPDHGSSDGPAADLWLVTANLLFLLGIASGRGADHPTVAANRELEPETSGIVLDLLDNGQAAPAWTEGRSLTEALPASWDRIAAAATARGQRPGSAAR